MKSGAVGETRTRDRRFRKPLLYPAELPPRKRVRTGMLSTRVRQGKTTLDSPSCEPTFRLLSTFGVVAQLVRASACHAEGRGFESRPSRHLILPGLSSDRVFSWRNPTGAPAANTIPPSCYCYFARAGFDLRTRERGRCWFLFLRLAGDWGNQESNARRIGVYGGLFIFRVSAPRRPARRKANSTST
jgi:hypothetical protein